MTVRPVFHRWAFQWSSFPAQTAVQGNDAIFQARINCTHTHGANSMSGIW